MSWQGGQYGASGYSESLKNDPRARRNLQMSLMSRLRYGPGLTVDKNGAIVMSSKAGVDQDVSGGGGGTDLRFLLSGVDAPDTDTTTFQRPESGGYLGSAQTGVAGNSATTSIDVSTSEPQPLSRQMGIHYSTSSHTVNGGSGGGGNATYALASIWASSSDGTRFAGGTEPYTDQAIVSGVKMANGHRFYCRFTAYLGVNHNPSTGSSWKRNARSRFKWYTQTAAGAADDELWYSDDIYGFRDSASNVSYGGEQTIVASFIVDLSAVDPAGSMGAYTTVALYSNRPSGQTSTFGNMKIHRAELTVVPVGPDDATTNADVAKYANPITGATSTALSSLSTGVGTVEGNLNGAIDVIGPAYADIDSVTSAHLSAYNSALAALQEEVMLIRELIGALSGGGPS